MFTVTATNDDGVLFIDLTNDEDYATYIADRASVRDPEAEIVVRDRDTGTIIYRLNPFEGCAA